MLQHDIRCNVPDLLDDVGIATQIRLTKKNMDVARASMDAARAGHSMDVARMLPGCCQGWPFVDRTISAQDTLETPLCS